ncbi:hypothetical protein I6N95_03460 [Vagococcus sp. BWB3-3]|uniref:V-type ATP synthase subunit F n=1 Tax=Vagococcus allomyrinae TaxID=2794353 RepID=A0A940STU4_9ENTE|nr:hypothetical protein [Vagococcus allomyrinae]MBP1040064.1 hypothetical protein [Vagococcus allomyrinae]
MSKVIYLSYQQEGVMTSLGMEVRLVERETDLLTLFRQLKRQHISLVYVSEQVYQEHVEVIRGFNKDFDLTISLLPNQLHHKKSGEKRLNQIIEEAIGLKVG